MNLDDCTEYVGKHGYVLCDAAEYRRLQRMAEIVRDADKRFGHLASIYSLEDSDEVGSSFLMLGNLAHLIHQAAINENA